jgi:hypothetical protein
MNQTDREEAEMLRRRQTEDDALRGVYASPGENRYGFGKILKSRAIEEKKRD